MPPQGTGISACLYIISYSAYSFKVAFVPEGQNA